MHEEDLTFLSEDYKDILKHQDEIKNSFKIQPRKLNYLWGIIADLYNDRAKIKGLHNIQSKMPALKNILNNYNHEDLVAFFQKSL